MPRAARKAASALRLFCPLLPSISPGEKPARSRRTCSSSAAGATGRADRADRTGRLAASSADVPERTAAPAAKHHRALNANVIAPFAECRAPPHATVFQQESDEAVQYRSRPPDGHRACAGCASNAQTRVSDRRILVSALVVNRLRPV